jgi:hypothetical protein
MRFFCYLFACINNGSNRPLLHLRKNHFQFNRIIIFCETPKMGTNKTTQRREKLSTTLMTSLYILRI